MKLVLQQCSHARAQRPGTAVKAVMVVAGASSRSCSVLLVRAGSCLVVKSRSRIVDGLDGLDSDKSITATTAGPTGAGMTGRRHG